MKVRASWLHWYLHIGSLYFLFLQFGDKLESQIYEPWIDQYISYKRLKRILSKIEMQQQKAKRVSEKQRETEAAELQSSPRLVASTPRSVNNNSPMAVPDSPSTAPLPAPLTLGRNTSSTKYTSPLIRAYGATNDRSNSPLPISFVQFLLHSFVF